ncbi:hypothetical protein C1645_819841 [Glomus cerebriforme]|uniref:Uncharacterized protein n=1 Tax=Glomus cerebriforme TaxID=658196 RepID=A0A397T4A4_9GLOM|nr:hypothetical protein C1645_819841 [Glomus cerebriforme]
MGIHVLKEKVVSLQGFGARQVTEQDAILLEIGAIPIDDDREIRELLDINEATAALIRIIAQLIYKKSQEQTRQIMTARGDSLDKSIYAKKPKIERSEEGTEMFLKQYYVRVTSTKSLREEEMQNTIKGNKLDVTIGLMDLHLINVQYSLTEGDTRGDRRANQKRWQIKQKKVSGIWGYTLTINYQKKRGKQELKKLLRMQQAR